MKKKLFGFLLIAVLLLSISIPAFAVDDGYVVFNANKKMEEQNFNINQVFDGLEPGDNAVYNVHIRNLYTKTTHWYMTNEVINSLELSSNISGGAYTYVLTYTDPSGKITTLYDSSAGVGTHFVGGDTPHNGRTGLEEATETLEDHFFIDTLNTGESGLVTLYVSLEGETQGNSYQNTNANLQMDFAVEVLDGKVVKTGDTHRVLPYYIGMAVAGLLFMYLVLDAYTDRKYKKGRE